MHDEIYGERQLYYGKGDASGYIELFEVSNGTHRQYLDITLNMKTTNREGSGTWTIKVDHSKKRTTESFLILGIIHIFTYQFSDYDHDKDIMNCGTALSFTTVLTLSVTGLCFICIMIHCLCIKKCYK